jgi:ferredoxin
MAIPTSRTHETGRIIIDTEKCNGCGLCVDACPDWDLVLIDGKAAPSQQGGFGCIGCGHCMAICPQDAIFIEGRCLSRDDIFPLPGLKEVASYESLLSLYQRRRSIRHFRDRAVEPQLIEQILKAAVTAPMGLPPSDVNVMVLDSRDKVRVFAEDYCRYLQTLKWFVSRWFMNLMRPFWGKETYDMFRDFLRPLVHKYTESMKNGKDIVTYDAPVAIYFYGSPYTDPADPLIAATYAMLAAESLGLGTCFLGAIHPFIQSGPAARKFRERHGVRYKSREGVFVIVGYPRFRFQSGIRRSFASVDYRPS